MTPKWEGKNWENFTLGALGSQGGLRGPPKPPIGRPELQKWSTRHPQSLKNRLQDTPRASKKVPKRAQNTQNGTQAAPKNPKRRPSFQTIQKKRSRTNEHTHTHTNTHTHAHTHTLFQILAQYASIPSSPNWTSNGISFEKVF